MAKRSRQIFETGTDPVFKEDISDIFRQRRGSHDVLFVLYVSFGRYAFVEPLRLVLDGSEIAAKISACLSATGFYHDLLKQLRPPLVLLLFLRGILESI